MKTLTLFALFVLMFVFASCGASDAVRAVVPIIADSRDSAQGPTEQAPAPPAAVPPATAALSPAQIFAVNRDAVFILRGVCAEGHSWTGSGFFINSAGVAVTNHHVIDGLIRATAILYDGSEFNVAGFFSYDTANDLAVIQVDGTGFDYVTLGDSDAVMVGETVFAIGGPDWEPLTFTDGMISRIAYEPIFFDGYSIAGLFQSTAAIYGGNSGGPLINDRGHVIGVNAATSMVRASVQFAVPINRVSVPAPNAVLRPLPVGAAPLAQQVFTPGQVAFLEHFPFIPDFLSISRNASLAFSGTPADLGLMPGDIIFDFYMYLFMYTIPERHWIPDTDEFDAVLMQNGFVFQDIVHFDGEVWVYFYHPGIDVSLSYAFMHDFETLLIALVDGNVHEAFYGDGAGAQQPFPPHTSHDPALIGTWEFWLTTSDLYLELMDAGERLIYIFNPGGTGYWGGFNDYGQVTREIPMFWETSDGWLGIDFPSIDLFLIYEYKIFGDELYMWHFEDEHLLLWLQ